MKSFKDYYKQRSLIEHAMKLAEELPTRVINPDHFPNPITNTMAKLFLTKGHKDGDAKDDIVKTSSVSIAASELMPTQSEIFMGKAIGMAIGGIAGGDLAAIISKDNYILDGHHRWAATMLANPSAKVGGVKADLGIGDLVPVLRALGDALGNSRRGAPGGGDISLYDASFKDVLEIIKTGKYSNPRFYDKAKAEAWLNKIGEKELEKRFNTLKAKRPPSGAPVRRDMPVIDADKSQQHTASALLNKGDLDIRSPYAKLER
jgi:hypothetical protein